MNQFRIVLAILALILIIVTLIVYFNIKKKIRNTKKVTKVMLEKEFKKFNILFIIGFILSIIAIFVGVFNGLNTIHENRNINSTKYEFYISQYQTSSDIHSNLDYFPKNIDNNYVLEFSEFNRDGLFDGSYLIYLKYQYSESEFVEELNKIKRISNTKIEKNNYTYYVISDDGYNTKEYIIIDSNNIITYVFCQLFTSKEIDDFEDNITY